MNGKDIPQPSLPPLAWLDETDSTNRYLARLCDAHPGNVPELATVIADYQTAGKGQRGNSWEAERGKNLLFSFVLYPTFMEASRQFALSQLVSLAIKEELAQQSTGFSIKWPNDIYWEERKICGILVEHDLCGNRLARSVCGVGINVNQERFLGNAPNPVSLCQVTGRQHDRKQLLEGIVLRIGTYYQRLREDTTGHFAAGLAARYTQSLFRRDGFHPYADKRGTFRARLVRVETDGQLVLEDETGEVRRYWFKEVAYDQPGQSRAVR